jgi:ABC-type amino acid transport substrate-binding protein
MSSSLIRKCLETRPLLRPGIWLGLALLGGGAAQAAPVRFCVDKANPLVTVDIAVAQAVSERQKLDMVLVTRDSSQDDEDADSGLSQEKFFARLSKTCDLIMGFPVEAQFENLPRGMAATAPYVGTGFVTATTSMPIAGFDEMAADRQIGVVFLTVASTYFTDQTMAHEHVYYTNDQLYGALLHGEVNAALIWQPWLNRELAAHPQKLHVARLGMPHAAWNIVALYPQSATGAPAVRAFDQGVARLEASGKLAAVVHPYAVPAMDQRNEKVE